MTTTATRAAAQATDPGARTSASGYFRRDAEQVQLDTLRALGVKAENRADTDELLTSGSLARLRAMTPKRRLSPRELEGIAERQAGRLRSELGMLGPRIDEEDLARLPWLTITHHDKLPSSGLTTKTDYGWLVVLRSSEANVRQRFSLAHEIKHCLDDPFVDQLYVDQAGYTAHERAERVCDRFAAALLMPRVLLRADWADGIQDIAKLARRYDVSRAAMTVRLSQLGLLAPVPRCPAPTAAKRTSGGES